MSSEHSERAPSDKAKAWVERYLYGEQVENKGYSGRWPENGLADSFDAGHSEGEKKGAAVGYLKALREVRQIHLCTWDRVRLSEALDRRIREAEENANG